jgi:exopolysaccharide biosynthesis protein
VDNEWIRLPWKGRTALGLKRNGQARIDNMQVNAYVQFGGGLNLPISDLNGWPDKGRVTALTRRFGNYYKLRSGEMALEVKDGKVVSKPGGGGVAVHSDGFTLIASGGARQWLNKVKRGEIARLRISPIGWSGIVSALGAGPRLLKNGQVFVAQEGFRSDVRNGRSPRTAFGIDKQGRYMLLVVDGRRPGYSGGLTLTELAYILQKHGAVDAMNLDGGGSTTLTVRNRLLNRPSDGYERAVANALLITRKP